MRVPLIFAWPGKIAPGTKTDALVSWVDLLPTLFEAAGGQPPATGLQAGELDGSSFLPVLRSERALHRDRIFTTHSGDKNMNVYPIRSLRIGHWKYIRNLHHEFQHTTHVDRAQAEDEVGYWRSWERAAAAGQTHAQTVLQRYRQRPAEELYNLQTDPTEQVNLADQAEFAQQKATMDDELTAWMRAQGDQRRVFGQPLLLPSAAREPVLEKQESVRQ